jgi:hypothetical protein
MADTRDIPETRRPYSDPDVTFRADVANLVNDLRGSGMAAPPPRDLTTRASPPSRTSRCRTHRRRAGRRLMRTETDNDAGLRAIDEIVGGGVTGGCSTTGSILRWAWTMPPRVPSARRAKPATTKAVARDDLDDELPDSV